MSMIKNTRHLLKNSGITVLEALIGMVILSIAMAGFAKQWTTSTVSNIDVSERIRIAAIGTNLNSVVVAHASTLDPTLPVDSYFSSVQNFTDQLKTRINSHIAGKGVYHCSPSNQPVLATTGVGVPLSSGSTSTLLDPLDKVSAVCITFKFIKRFDAPAEGGTRSYGLQMETQANWIEVGGKTSGSGGQLSLPLVVFYPRVI